MRRVAIVPHTHWDREWYAPFQAFRLRLVDLLDEFLPLLERDLSYARFLLDGQMAVVDDYLEVRPGRPMSDIGRAIQSHAEEHGYGVVRAFVGHGIGEQFHTDLHIPHYFDPRATTVMEPGMTFTIEPMITMGDWRHRLWDDGWTAVTADGRRTAQFEHTVLVTADGREILTLP